MAVNQSYGQFQQNLPMSWQYGSFEPASKMQTQFVESLFKASQAAQRPLTATAPQHVPSAASKTVADEEYFRAAAQDKVNNSLERKMQRKQNLVETFMSSNNDMTLASKLNRETDIILPRETLYLIDKVVRKRTKEGEFGNDYTRGLWEEFNKMNKEALTLI